MVARTRRRIRAGRAAFAASALACVTACGATELPPPAADSTWRPSGGGSPSGGFGPGTAGAPPGCGRRDDGSACECVDVPLFADPPNLYFVLDRSGSMEIDDRWNQVRVTMAKLLRGLGPRANVGAALFPGAPDACAAGAEVMSTRAGDAPSAADDGPTTRLFLDVSRVNPSGGTPTAATMRHLLPTVTALSGKSFVILATDGAPNCNRTASCNADACVPNIEGFCSPAGPSCCEPPTGLRENCLDTDAAVSAVQAYAAAGVPVYVVGIPGSAPYAAVLDQMAEAGGTALPATPRHYRVDDAQDLLTALRKVAAKIVATCDYPLEEAPSDPNAVNVYLDDVAVPKDAANGWTLEGQTVRLVGATCARVLAGEVLGVRIIAGCPTILPR